MKTIKCEIEIDDDREFRFAAHRVPIKGDYYYYNNTINRTPNDWEDNKMLCFELVEPPLELNSNYFIFNCVPNKLSSAFIILNDHLFIGTLKLDNDSRRDLMKILEYVEKYNKLPDRVVLKGKYEN